MAVICAVRRRAFMHEAEAMRQQGLIRGASTEMRLCSAATRSESAARFVDEFVRHKVLDLIGDLALIESRFWIGGGGPLVTPCTPRWCHDCCGTSRIGKKHPLHAPLRGR
jgi:hypothetical protein